jgi:hypothetical protein
VQPASIDLNALRADGAEQEAHERAKMSLEELVTLGEKLEALTAQKEQLERQLSELGEQINELQNRVIPDALTQLRLNEFTLEDGTVIEKTEIITAGIGDANRLEALAWLRDHGHGDIIKNEVKVVFGKGEDGYAIKLLRVLSDMRQQDALRCGAVEQKETVNYQTLNAFVRGRLKAGDPLPLETFKVFIGQVAKLKRPKESKI